VYLAHPTGANLAEYNAAVKATQAGQAQFNAAMNSPGTQSSADAQELAAIGKMLADSEQKPITVLRQAVQGRHTDMLTAFGGYTKIILDEPAVFQSEANQMTNPTSLQQGIGLIASINAREDLLEQQAMLAAALASGNLTQPERVVFAQAAGRQEDDTASYGQLLSASELAIYNNTQNKLAPQQFQQDLKTVQQAVEGGLTLGQMQAKAAAAGTPLTSASWAFLTGKLANANFQADTLAAEATLAADNQIAANAKKTVFLTGAIGAGGLILTLAVTILIGRSINRRLTFLRRSALTLAQQQLPAVIGRLRRGEPVDPAAEAPTLRVGGDEIGQVGQAFDTVRQTAIRAAIEESRLRQAISDVFRNLARRNQSLLHRQLSVLDAMERRATDPEVLDDLFRLDHLTTRMRRHAEGLIILSGAPPGRSWSSPVRMIDVLRGAAAEVEDYARVTAVTQSRTSLSGSAVTDVIHLLAELIENATQLSPPYTTVRVAGEIVANGFVIEVEDRGLGMSPQRFAELNNRLSNPPEFNPANTEQLGLFVVGQLARRHGVHVMLRPSPYGGATAIVFIPRQLIVAEEAITAGSGPAIVPGTIAPEGPGIASPLPAGGPPFGPAEPPFGPAEPPFGPAEPPFGPGGPGGPFGGPPGSLAGAGAPGGHGGPGPNGNGNGLHGGPNGFGGPNGANGMPADPFGDAAFADGPPGLAAPGAPTFGTGIRISGALRNAGNDETRPPAPTPPAHVNPSGPFAGNGTGMGPGNGTGMGGGPFAGNGGGTGAGRVVPGVTEPVDFNVFSQAKPNGGQPGLPARDPHAAGPGAGGGPGAGPRGGQPGGNGRRDMPGSATTSPMNGDELPRRVRQASLAPQLRSSSPLPGPQAQAGAGGPGTPAQGTPASPADIRSTMSAMQRGWQQGRSEIANHGDPEERQES
jgi:signal transduction histidine kinase